MKALFCFIVGVALVYEANVTPGVQVVESIVGGGFIGASISFALECLRGK